MKINWKLVSFGLAALAVYYEVTIFKSDKLIKSQNARLSYLADKLDAHDIEMTEFDRVVLYGL